MIVIPILNMPKGCGECPCNADSYCGVLFYLTGDCYSLPMEYAYSKNKRDFNCPLIEKKPGIRILREKLTAEKLKKITEQE